MPFSEQDLADRAAQLDLVAAEADAALANQDARASSIEGRAGLLTGAAAVLGAVQVTTATTGWVVALLILSFVAAVLGVIVVRPRWNRILDPNKFVEPILGLEPKTALLRLVEEKQWIFAKKEPGLQQRAVLVLVGYVVLLASIVVTLVIALIPIPAS